MDTICNGYTIYDVYALCVQEVEKYMIKGEIPEGWEFYFEDYDEDEIPPILTIKGVTIFNERDTIKPKKQIHFYYRTIFDHFLRIRMLDPEIDDTFDTLKEFINGLVRHEIRHAWQYEAIYNTNADSILYIYIIDQMIELRGECFDPLEDDADVFQNNNLHLSHDVFKITREIIDDALLWKEKMIAFYKYLQKYT